MKPRRRTQRQRCNPNYAVGERYIATRGTFWLSGPWNPIDRQMHRCALRARSQRVVEVIAALEVGARKDLCDCTGPHEINIMQKWKTSGERTCVEASGGSVAPHIHRKDNSGIYERGHNFMGERLDISKLDVRGIYGSSTAQHCGK